MKYLGKIYVQLDPAQEHAVRLSKSKERKLCLLLLCEAGEVGRGETHEKGRRERSGKRTEPQT